MTDEARRSPPIRFGIYEIDLRAGELRKRGVRLKLQEQPFQVLAMLLQRPGEVVTREELRRALWPADVFVGVDHSLGTAVNKIREALGDSAANPRFIETLARRGYRFIAPVETAAEGSTADARAIDSLAVLPFENVGADPEAEYLSDGLTESLINSLSRLPRLKVMARSTVFRYKGRAVDPLSAGRELGVRAVVVGRVQPRPGSLTIGTELVEVRSGWRLWGERYSLKPVEVHSVEGRISREISEKLRLELTRQQRERVSWRYTESEEAYREYLQGRYQLNRMTQEGLTSAVARFEAAVRLDPAYALAWTALSSCYGLFAFFSLFPPDSVMPKARETALKALDLDDDLAEAHAALATVRKVYEWDWSGAEREYQRALELNLGNATVHHGYASFLSAVGRSQDALREIHRAQELDPLSLIMSMEVAWNLYMARDHEASIEQSRKTLGMEPGFAPALHSLGLALEALGRHTEAIEAFEKGNDGSAGQPASLCALGRALALAGREREARGILDQVTRISERSYVSSYLLAILQAGLGDRDAALESLDRAYADRDVWLVWLHVDPRLDPLRSLRRFTRLERSLGFPV